LFFPACQKEFCKNSGRTYKNELEASRNKRRNTDETGGTDDNGFFYSASQSKSLKIHLISVIRVLLTKMFFEKPKKLVFCS